MATRFRITDFFNNSLTLQLNENVMDRSGTWMPDDNTKVRSSSNQFNNPYDAVNSGSSPYDAVLYTSDDAGMRIPVMRMNKTSGMVFFESAGAGELFATGAQGGFAAGAITRKKL